MLQKGNYLKLEIRYIKTVFRNGIYDKFCIRMGVLWIFDKVEENRYFFHRPSTLIGFTFRVETFPRHQNLEILRGISKPKDFCDELHKNILSQL